MKIGDKIGTYVALSDDGTWEAIVFLSVGDTEKKQIFGSKGHKTAEDAIQAIMDNARIAVEVFITAKEIEYPHPEGE